MKNNKLKIINNNYNNINNRMFNLEVNNKFNKNKFRFNKIFQFPCLLWRLHIFINNVFKIMKNG